MKPLSSFFLPLRRLYHWCLSWADHPHSLKALCLLALSESIFFPVPVDPLLIAMGFSKPRRSLYFAGWATTCSVLGALGGYFLGAYLWESIAPYVTTEGSYFSTHFDMAKEMFQDNTMWAMVLAGFTFLPFKVFTLTAGVFQVALWPFFLGCLIGRSSRFFLISGLLYYWGPQIRTTIENHFEKATLLGTLIVILGIFLYKFL